MKYYSFYVGYIDTDHRSWLLYNIKMPSDHVRTAIITFMTMKTLIGARYDIAPSNLRLMIPSRTRVNSQIRMILEYQRTDNCKTANKIHRYELMRRVHPYHYLRYFHD